MKRDESSLEDASSRLRSQMPVTEKVAYADQVLDNSGLLEHLENQVDTLVKRLVEEAGWTWILSWVFPPIGIFSAACILAWKALRRSFLARRSKTE
jgi:dephospho-CoA kinase